MLLAAAAQGDRSVSGCLVKSYPQGTSIDYLILSSIFLPRAFFHLFPLVPTHIKSYRLIAQVCITRVRTIPLYERANDAAPFGLIL
jgi:hypothetical protein